MTRTLIFPLLFISGITQAGIVTNDTELLSANGHLQITEWLGEDVDLTRIFAKGVDGTNSIDWHSAVDGKGKTITLIEIFSDSGRMVIGGYNDTSWRSGYSSNYDKNSTNFIFNLSTGLNYNFSQENGVTTGQIPSQGPSFGSSDLRLYSELNKGVSYAGRVYSAPGIESYEEDQSFEFTGSYNKTFEVGKMETFLISESTGDFGSGATADIDESLNINDVPILNSSLALLLILGFRRKA